MLLFTKLCFLRSSCCVILLSSCSPILVHGSRLFDALYTCTLSYPQKPRIVAPEWPCSHPLSLEQYHITTWGERPCCLQHGRHDAWFLLLFSKLDFTDIIDKGDKFEDCNLWVMHIQELALSDIYPGKMCVYYYFYITFFVGLFLILMHLLI